MLNLYYIFHLNIAYSSIEEEQRPEVIERCYWPLLRLVEELDLPVGIEASGYTLETIQEIEPSWITKLRSLLQDNRCEFVGSGYMQIIGPLVPSEVNRHNQQIGLEVYKQLLGVRPKTALVNEQAYSAGMAQHYLDAAYEAIMMEWNNPAKYHPEWSKEWRYYSQNAIGSSGNQIPIIWTDSIAFQKFQRYVHGESELSEYVDYLRSNDNGSERFFPLYANDVEIFDFRPERYKTEADMDTNTEWKRIADLFKFLKEDNTFRLIQPADVLNGLITKDGGNLLRLESAEQPIPVKKQEKFNINRWALTGRDDLKINTKCYQIYYKIKEKECATNEDWKELCYLWSSDFRTHITQKRWDAYLLRLRENAKKFCIRK